MSPRIFLIAALLASSAFAGDAPKMKMESVRATPVAADPAAGKKLYQRWCTQCHGDEGKGDGPAAEFVYPRPRDFTLALFKVRSTPSGQLPTDHDLFKVISEGLPGTSMPAWNKYLSENERWRKVLDYLFSANGADWKLAVIEADAMLEALLDQLGFKGETFSDKLKTADPEKFHSLPAAWEVHAIRNRIAHEGSEFSLSQHEAKRVVALYESIFRQYGYI